MFYKIYQPHPALKEFINHIVIYDLSVGTSIEAPVFPFPPLPENFLYIYIFDSPSVEYFDSGHVEKMPMSVTIGQQTSRIRLHMPRQNVCVRIAFQPAGLYRLLGMPMNKYFLDIGQDSSEFFKDELKYLREQLQETISTEQMKAIVEVFLLKKLAKLKSKLPIDHVLPLIINSGGMMKIEDIAYQSCVSFRQLERQFHQRIGVSPKFYLRLTRFAKAWMMREANPSMSWINIAYQCGYFDQMHFIRDFKEFAGVPPSVIEADIAQSAQFLKTGLKL
jgi:AraC-like DNA-binding protein